MSGSADSHPSEFRPSGIPFTRRQFAVALAGGAAVAAAGSRLLTVSTAPPPLTEFPPARTSFGSVAIEGAKRMARFGSGTFAPAADRAEGHGHGPALTGPDPTREPPNQTWADIVVLWLSVRNASGGPVYVSPGQLRLRIPSGGITVTPRNSASALVEVPARSSRSTWVSYLAPAGVRSEFLADFSDPALDNPVTLALPVAIPAAEARSSADPWAA